MEYAENTYKKLKQNNTKKSNVKKQETIPEWFGKVHEKEEMNDTELEGFFKEFS